jgi:hypothetical protein
MRYLMISLAAFAAAIAFVGMPSAVTALTEAQSAAPTPSTHHQIRVNDAVRTVRPAHAPLFAS